MKLSGEYKLDMSDLVITRNVAVAFYQLKVRSLQSFNLLIFSFQVNFEMGDDERVFEIGKYIIYYQQQIGKGAHANVYRCAEKIAPQKKTFCAKVIQLSPRSLLNNNELDILKKIIEKKKSTDCLNIVQTYLIEEIKSSKQMVIIMEYCESNLKLMLEKQKKILPQEALNIVKQIINGYKVLHELKITHRDLKPENILVQGEIIKLADFGEGKLAEDPDEVFKTMGRGSPAYQAPEVSFLSPDVNPVENTCQYNNKADLFSKLGLIFYELIFGILPYGVLNKQITRNHITNFYEQIKKNTFKIDLSQFKKANDQPNDMLIDKIQSLLQEMLQFLPQNRISWENLFQHPLIQQSQSPLSQQETTPTQLPDVNQEKYPVNESKVESQNDQPQHLLQKSQNQPPTTQSTLNQISQDQNPSIPPALTLISQNQAPNVEVNHPKMHQPSTPNGLALQNIAQAIQPQHSLNQTTQGKLSSNFPATQQFTPQIQTPQTQAPAIQHNQAQVPLSIANSTQSIPQNQINQTQLSNQRSQTQYSQNLLSVSKTSQAPPNQNCQLQTPQTKGVQTIQQPQTQLSKNSFAQPEKIKNTILNNQFSQNQSNKPSSQQLKLHLSTQQNNQLQNPELSASNFQLSRQLASQTQNTLNQEQNLFSDRKSDQPRQEIKLSGPINTNGPIALTDRSDESLNYSIQVAIQKCNELSLLGDADIDYEGKANPKVYLFKLLQQIQSSNSYRQFIIQQRDYSNEFLYFWALIKIAQSQGDYQSKIELIISLYHDRKNKDELRRMCS